MNMDDLNKRTGEAIQRAAGELPEGYELIIEIERYAGTVKLYIPSNGDDESGQVIDEFCGDDIACQIENAVNMSIEHDKGVTNDKF